MLEIPLVGERAVSFPNLAPKEFLAPRFRTRIERGRVKRGDRIPFIWLRAFHALSSACKGTEPVLCNESIAPYSVWSVAFNDSDLI